jgi:hypothetical protein
MKNLQLGLGVLEVPPPPNFVMYFAICGHFVAETTYNYRFLQPPPPQPQVSSQPFQHNVNTKSIFRTHPSQDRSNMETTLPDDSPPGTHPVLLSAISSTGRSISRGLKPSCAVGAFSASLSNGVGTSRGITDVVSGVIEEEETVLVDESSDGAV